MAVFTLHRSSHVAWQELGEEARRGRWKNERNESSEEEERNIWVLVCQTLFYSYQDDTHRQWHTLSLSNFHSLPALSSLSFPPRLKHQSLFLPHSVCLWRFFLPDFVSSSSSSPSFPLLCVCFLARLFISSPAAGWHFILFPPHCAALLGLAQLLQPYSVTHFTLLFPHARMHTCIHTH